MPESAPVSVLRSLPLSRWARHLVSGTVRLEGRLDHAMVVPVDDADRAIASGPVRIEVAFEGGVSPCITHLAVDHAGGQVVGSRNLGPALGSLVDTLHDLAIEISVHTDGEVVLELGRGMQAMIDDGGSITLKASAHGTPEAPRLVAPLQIDVANRGIRVTHSRVPGLARVARVRVHRFALHPDGAVDLDGGARGVLDVAVVRGLRRVSSRLSALIRESPRFERVRAFLHPTE